MSRNTINLKTRIALADWLRTPGRTLNKTAAQLTKEASEALGEHFVPRQIIYLCKELEIPYLSSKTSLSPQESAAVRQDLRALEHRMTEVEENIQRLISDLRILKGFYINTVKKPNQESSSAPEAH